MFAVAEAVPQVLVADDSKKTSYYEVVIKISDIDDAGTKSPMFIQIFGDGGATELTPLDADTNKNLFERNTENKFTINATDVGQVSYI